MKLCRYGKAGYEKPGMIDAEGRLRDLSKVVDNIGPNEISPRGLKMLSKVKPESLPPVSGNPRLGVPYVGIGKFVAIGLNYSDHAKEAGLPIPAEPIVFMKATTCISGPHDDVIQPKGSTKLDWEVELGIVIGTQAKYVSESEALNHVAGYCIALDMVIRGTEDRSWRKSYDTFSVLGPLLTTHEEVKDPNNLDFWIKVNGETRQASNTKYLIFGLAKLISYASQAYRLYPGDVIMTGTQEGVGPVVPGDIMDCRIDQVGEMQVAVTLAS